MEESHPQIRHGCLIASRFVTICAVIREGVEPSSRTQVFHRTPPYPIPLVLTLSFPCLPGSSRWKTRLTPVLNLVREGLDYFLCRTVLSYWVESLFAPTHRKSRLYFERIDPLLCSFNPLDLNSSVLDCCTNGLDPCALHVPFSIGEVEMTLPYLTLFDSAHLYTKHHVSRCFCRWCGTECARLSRNIACRDVSLTKSCATFSSQRMQNRIPS
jgi:hypothetical protein